MPVVEQSGMRLEYPAGDEQSIRSEGAIKLRARVIPPHVNNRVWFVYRIDEGQWIRRQATRDFASIAEEQHSLAVDMSTARAGLRYLTFVRRGGITVPRGADTTFPDGDQSLKELTVYVSLTHDNAASRQPRSSDERSHDSGVELPSAATAKVAGLSMEATGHLTSKVSDIPLLDPAAARDLVAEGALAEADADKLSVATVALDVTGGDEEAADKVMAALVNGSLNPRSPRTTLSPSVGPVSGGAAPPPSEFERHLRAVNPHLAGADIAELPDDRLAELAQQTGIDRVQVDLLAQAVKLRRRIDRLAGDEAATPTAAESAKTEIVYGLLREGAFANPDSRSASDIEAASRRAIETGVVSAGVDESARETVNRLNRVAVLLPSGTSRASLGDALATLPRDEQLTEDEELRFATLHTSLGEGEPLWAAVQASDLSARLKPLKRTITLQQLTGSFAPVMRALQTRPDAASDETGGFLAAVRPREWREARTCPRLPRRGGTA